VVFGGAPLALTDRLWRRLHGLQAPYVVAADGGAATALAFGGASLLLAAVPAAAAGLGLYALILLAVRQLGLAEAWHHVRALR
jgi:hypothetical protein